MASWWTTPVTVFGIATLMKLLLVPAYRSTDFEVHRNWLAITHSLPVSRWYYEETSEWTLDYPPFFAWFEWLLSWFAALVDPAITRVDNLNYAAPACVLFQRLSVAVSDFTLLYAVVQYCQLQERRASDEVVASMKTLILSVLLLFNYGLMVVDSIHFQYNGFLFGILLLSIVRLMQGRCLEGAMLFAVLLNFKHIFLYVAPAYFVYLLKHYCFHDNNNSDDSKLGKRPWTLVKNFSPQNFLKLGFLVIAIFCLSFGPFVAMGQLGQVLSRLFPFKRGLCHAYWAPNFWALYNTADKVLSVAGSRLGLISPSSVGAGGMTSGLIGEMQHQLLPSVPPWVTMVTTLLAMMPALLWLWLKKYSSPVDFLKCLILCAYASFLFGWHVHEKAIMMVTLPMCLLAVECGRYARIFLLLSTTAHVSLFPLLFKPAETLLKVSLFVLYTTSSFISLPSITRSSEKNENKEKRPHSELSSSSSLSRVESCYLLLLLLVQAYCLILHGLGGFLAHFEFLPLFLTSVFCSVGVVWTWVLCYWECFH